MSDNECHVCDVDGPCAIHKFEAFDIVAEILETKSQVDLSVPFARGRVTNDILAALTGAGYELVKLPEPERELVAEVEKLRAMLPDLRMWANRGHQIHNRDGDCICDGNPSTTNGPEEDCPWHGREYTYWVARADEVKEVAEVEKLRASRTECQCWVGHGDCGGCSGVVGYGHEPACGWEWNPRCPEHGALADENRKLRGALETIRGIAYTLPIPHEHRILAVIERAGIEP